MTNVIWPNVFIVGAAKAGTTSLYAYLKQHPQVFMSPVKEPHFFSKVQPQKEQSHIVKSITNESKYLSLFRDAGGFKAIGEASPSYLWSTQAPYRIREKVPNARIIVILRDPVDRAYSHYLMDVRGGYQKLPFYEAIRQDYDKAQKGWGVSHLYVELGLYHEQLRRYLGVFPPSQLLVLMFQDLRTDCGGLLLNVARFLNIDAKPIESIMIKKVHNPYASPRTESARWVLGSRCVRRMSATVFPRVLRLWVRDRLLLKSVEKPLLDPRARAFLKDIYRPEIEKLEYLLGKELSGLRMVW